MIKNINSWIWLKGDENWKENGGTWYKYNKKTNIYTVIKLENISWMNFANSKYELSVYEIKLKVTEIGYENYIRRYADITENEWNNLTDLEKVQLISDYRLGKINFYRGNNYINLILKVKTRGKNNESNK